ncbi:MULTISPECIES: hypothetical protein [unclassified Micromonospora]|uniref:hypothetical protein n=1 Tax=unclassified Micromonospora TaxID=2617518 RepID=UPI00098CFE04|nr:MULTISPECIES: hypothetical protein [unclassified Micromonospora]MDI5939001.1 hypothetical protein [Micromonospora sp. DH15]OON31925.1 hypothetical protein BSA16_08355 [Micromonospora sp. Rc5]
MLNEVRWIGLEPKVRHAFSLCRVREAGTPNEWYDLLGVVRVPVDQQVPDKLRDGLLPWALATLAAGGYGFGRYHAGYSTLDEDGEPDKALASEDINWSGSGVLVPVEKPAEIDSRLG